MFSLICESGLKMMRVVVVMVVVVVMMGLECKREVVRGSTREEEEKERVPGVKRIKVHYIIYIIYKL
jgi:Na+/H+ antiporter NhaA